MVMGPAATTLENWDRMLIKLPTQRRIRDIITKMQTLTTMTKLLPPNLQYTTTVSDTALLQNIQALFPPPPAAANINNHAEIIFSGLMAIVARTDDFMSEAQKRQINAQSSSLRTDQQRELVLFYPCLMALIRALLIHCQNLADQMKDEKDDNTSMHKCVLDAWQQIMGELHDVHSVIIFAGQSSLLDLGTFPTEWLQTIQSMNADISNLRNAILSLNDSLNAEQARVNERDKKLQQIVMQYAEADTKVQLIKAQKNNLLATLDSLTFIPNITHENIQRVQAAAAFR